MPKVRQIYHHDKKMLETNYCRKPWILLYCCFSMWMCYSSVYSFWTKFSLILLQVCIHYITLCFSTQKLLQYISSSLAQKDNKTRPPWMVHCVCKCVLLENLLCIAVDIVLYATFYLQRNKVEKDMNRMIISKNNSLYSINQINRIAE